MGMAYFTSPGLLAHPVEHTQSIGGTISSILANAGQFFSQLANLSWVRS